MKEKKNPENKHPTGVKSKGYLLAGMRMKE